jgi:double-stranded uracil-DNA glycosylase
MPIAALCGLYCVIKLKPQSSLMPKAKQIQSFAATETRNCRLLILGSMPGAASLAAGQYYAHPRNAFWPLMARLCAFDLALPYAARLQALQGAGVGLWDVLASCERSGSLDAAISPASVQINPIASFVRQQAKLRAIALNGGAAAKLFGKFVAPDLAERLLFEAVSVTPDASKDLIQVFTMPSTSPAHAALSIEQKWQAWRVLKRSLD